MTSSPLADLLDATAADMIAGVGAAIAATASDVAARRTIERLPGLMHGLVEQLRAGHADGTAQSTGLRIQFHVAHLVTAIHLLREAVYALIEERQIAATPREMRIIGNWFARVAESALLAENRRFAAMFDAIPDHLLMYGADGFPVVHLNQAVGDGAKDIADMSRDEMLGHRIVDIVHDKKFGQYVEDCLARVKGGESLTDEFLYPTPNGGRWHEQHMRPVYDPDGKVEAIAIASRDIHDRKKAEARLQLLSKLGELAETMEHASVIDAMAHLSIPELADWCLINVIENGHFQRATLAHRDPAKAALADELLRLPSQLHQLRVGEAALAGNATLIVEIGPTTEHAELLRTELVRRLEVRSAMVVPFVVMGVPVAIATFMMTPESGRRYGAEDLALAQEMARRAAQIIENARLHQQLRQSEARFRVALEHANIAVVETDPELRIRWIYNTRLALPDSALLGKTASEILGVAGAGLDELQRHVLATGEGARRTLSEIIDGKPRHFQVRYEPLRGIGGIVGLTGTTVDVTELKEAEELVARELAFRERMMGILGHDLRNPVSAVLALAGLLRLEDKLSDSAREQLMLIEQATRRMNEMIGTLLDFTRLRFHGALPVVVKEIDLDELTRGVVAELQAAHRRREIELSASGNLRGRWDPGRIAQLLSNLAANALWHGAREAPVRVALAGDGDAVRLSVSNRGPVIPPELVDRLFEPFQQGSDGSDGSSNGSRGLGLGLFIVREIVKAHGGTIDVRSRDELTTFAVTLPRAAPPS